MDVIPTWTWTVLVQTFFPAFTAPTTELFLALLTGWVLCTRRRTITGLLPFADPDGRHAHDAFHRFLREGRWERDTRGKLRTGLLGRTGAPHGGIEGDLDETRLHRWGRQIAGAGWWRDAVRATA